MVAFGRSEMELGTVDYCKEGAIARVTLNRPEKLNAMNEQMHRELGQVWEDFRDDPALRVAILSGNGRCFSAGADLSYGTPKSRYEYTGLFPDITHTRGVYKPIIAAMHSHVVGYGMWIALDADIRIAAEDVSFWLPEPQWGIATIPAAWLPRLMPWAIAAELLLTAERVDAQRAYQVGLVNKSGDGRSGHGGSRAGGQPDLRAQSGRGSGDEGTHGSHQHPRPQCRRPAYRLGADPGDELRGSPGRRPGVRRKTPGQLARHLSCS